MLSSNLSFSLSLFLSQLLEWEGNFYITQWIFASERIERSFCSWFQDWRNSNQQEKLRNAILSTFAKCDTGCVRHNPTKSNKSPSREFLIIGSELAELRKKIVAQRLSRYLVTPMIGAACYFRKHFRCTHLLLLIAFPCTREIRDIGTNPFEKRMTKWRNTCATIAFCIADFQLSARSRFVTVENDPISMQNCDNVRCVCIDTFTCYIKRKNTCMEVCEGGMHV